MTTEDIDRLAGVAAKNIVDTTEPMEWDNAVLCIGDAIRDAVVKAYDKAARATCFFCRAVSTPTLEGGNWLHGENNRCAAHNIHVLKRSLELTASEQGV